MRGEINGDNRVRPIYMKHDIQAIFESDFLKGEIKTGLRRLNGFERRIILLCFAGK